MSETDNEDKKGTEGPTDDIPMTFPQRLMEILSNEVNTDTITWLPHGKAFIIYKKKKFAADVLPKYFKQSKFTSFTRKLNRWGFTRVTRGPETGSYFHKFFLRDQPRLCMQMSCQNTRLQNEQMVMEQQMQSMAMPYGLGAPNAGGMNPGLNAAAATGMTGAMGGMSGGGMNAGMLGNNPALLQMQRQLQLEQQLQQQQQFELFRRAMVPQQQHQQQGIQQPQQQGNLNLLAGGAGGAGDAQKKDDLFYMQMLAQSKVSAQPLMRAIQNSLFQNPGYAPPPQPPQPSEADRAVRRASAA